jgi:hypothetical protein
MTDLNRQNIIKQNLRQANGAYTNRCAQAEKHETRVEIKILQLLLFV